MEARANVENSVENTRTANPMATWPLMNGKAKRGKPEAVPALRAGTPADTPKTENRVPNVQKNVVVDPTIPVVRPTCPRFDVFRRTFDTGRPELTARSAGSSASLPAAPPHKKACLQRSVPLPEGRGRLSDRLPEDLREVGRRPEADRLSDVFDRAFFGRARLRL